MRLNSPLLLFLLPLVVSPLLRAAELETTVVYAMRGNAPPQMRAAAAKALHERAAQLLEPKGGLVFGPEDWDLQLRNNGEKVDACKATSCELEMARRQRTKRAITGEVMLVGDTAYCTLRILQPSGSVTEHTFESTPEKLPDVLGAALDQLLVPSPSRPVAPPPRDPPQGTIVIVATRNAGDKEVRLEAGFDADSAVWKRVAGALPAHAGPRVTVNPAGLKTLREGLPPSDGVAEKLLKEYNAVDLVYVRVTHAAPKGAGEVTGVRFHHLHRQSAAERAVFEYCNAGDAACLQANLGTALPTVLSRVMPPPPAKPR